MQCGVKYLSKTLILCYYDFCAFDHLITDDKADLTKMRKDMEEGRTPSKQTGSTPLGRGHRQKKRKTLDSSSDDVSQKVQCSHNISQQTFERSDFHMVYILIMSYFSAHVSSFKLKLKYLTARSIANDRVHIIRLMSDYHLCLNNKSCQKYIFLK